MKPLIVLVGASGVGKTTLMQALCKKHHFAAAYEEHTQRPFQKLFKQNPQYALVNQLDYLIHKAEQEKKLRQLNTPAVMDGGLDLDFHGFTRLFHARAWLSDLDLDLCRRLYTLLRAMLPSPELIVMLHAQQTVMRQRLASRSRINIASSEDAALLEKFINEWLESINQEKILRLDVSNESIDYTQTISRIMENLNGKL